MKKIILHSLLVTCVLIFSSCHPKKSSLEKEYKITIENDINYLRSKFDSLIIIATGDSSIQLSYENFLNNYPDYIQKSGIVVDAHNLLIDLQSRQIFFNVWKLSWVMTLNYKCQIWLSFNIENGLFWEYYKKRRDKIQIVLQEPFEYIEEDQNFFAFEHIRKNCSNIDMESTFNRNLVSIIVLTRILNSE